VITATGDGVRIQVRVQPRAGRSEIVGDHGGALKVRIGAAPVDGAANEALIRLLADRLDVPRSAVAITAGEAARTKVVRVSGGALETAAARLGLLNFGPPRP
jgi:hypothetical protein